MRQYSYGLVLSSQQLRAQTVHVPDKRQASYILEQAARSEFAHYVTRRLRLSFYSCPGHRPWARVIICVAFFFFFLYYFSSARKWTNCAIVPVRPLPPSHALVPWQLKRSLEETKPPGFFKNGYRNVRKAYFDRRTTQSEFCFETNILCDRRSV